MRTSLDRAPSTPTPAEEAARMQILERRLWLDHAAIIVRMSDPGMATVVAAIGKTRFGNRLGDAPCRST